MIFKREGIYGVLREVADERIRQDAKWGEQNHLPIEWISILGEEFGEASKEAHEAHFKYSDAEESLKRYRKELVQVAAVAVSMIECLDRGKWKDNATNKD